MDENTGVARTEVLALTAEIVSAHVSNNTLDATNLPEFIDAVFGKLSTLATTEQATQEELTPAVPIKRSVTNDHIVCLEDGKKLKMLKRHLMTAHGMTPETCRAKWGLKADYPMIAPGYAERRRELAKKVGLGRKPVVPTEPAPKRRTKRKAA